jgi:hypothetical protein
MARDMLIWRTMKRKRQLDPGKTAGPRLPHERDETPEQVATGENAPRAPSDLIKQAAADVERGLVDTERRGTPSDVPAPRRRRAPPSDR